MSKNTGRHSQQSFTIENFSARAQAPTRLLRSIALTVLVLGAGALLAFSTHPAFAGTIDGKAGETASAATGPASPECTSGWQVAAGVNGPGDYNWLDGVAATASNDVWVVGAYQFIGNEDQTLIEHWNGGVWSVVYSPNWGGTSYQNDLHGVTALSSTDAWAVGAYDSGGDVGHKYRTLIEHWNGTGWSALTGPNQGTVDNRLLGVDAVSTNDVWAVGYFGSSFYDQHALIEHWNGNAWSIVTSPILNTPVTLDAVAAVSTNNIWAAGAQGDNGRNLALIEHWDGTAWHKVVSPDPTATGDSALRSLAVVGVNDVWAVGDYCGSTPHCRTLTEQWNGTAWSIVPSPNVDTSNGLYGVAAVSANDVWAVGHHFGDNDHQPLIEHWSGSNWSVVRGNIIKGYGELHGIAAASSSAIWAVGQGDYQIHALVEQYGCLSPTPTSTNTPTFTPTFTATSTPTPLTPTQTPGGPTATNTPTSTPTPYACANTYISADVPKPIFDDSIAGVNSNLLITGATGSISDIDLTLLHISHTWVGDLVVTLKHVDTNKTVTMIYRPGVPASTYGCGQDNYFSITLDDSAATAIEDTCTSNLTGPFKPNNPMSLFNGDSPNGTWTLNVSDRAAEDAGTLLNWGLRIASSPCNTPTAIPTNTATFTHTATSTRTPLSPTLTPTNTRTPTPGQKNPKS